MPTVAEMELLNRSTDDLARTLTLNRQMRATERERQRRESLDRDLLHQRMQDSTADREDRRLAREDRLADSAADRALRERQMQLSADQQKVLAQIRDESMKMQDRHYQLMRSTGLLKEMQAGLANGTIKLDSFKKQLADNPMLKDLGLSMDLFQVPPAKETRPFQTREGYNLQMADELRQKSRDMLRNEGGSSDAARAQSIAERLERSVGPDEKQKDPLESMMSDLGGAPAAGPAVRPVASPPSPTPVGPAAAAQPGAGRVKVIAPDGQRGSIPASQLEEALAKGYKRAQ